MELKLDGSTKFAAVPMLPPGGERHDLVGEPLFILWWKIRPCLSLPLGPALLPQSLQGQLPCENGEGPCVHETVVWLLTSSRCVKRKHDIRARASLSPHPSGERQSLCCRNVPIRASA